MSFRYNSNNQRGTPANNSSAEERAQQNQRPRGPRPRDARRMRDFNMRQSQRDGDDWAEEARIDSMYRSVAPASRPPPQVGGGRPPQQQSKPREQHNRGPPPVKTPVTETPPKDEPLYSGNGRGSKPVKKTLGQNMDLAGFSPLVRQVYDRMAVEDPQLSRKLPFAIFQHAMVEFLVAYQLHQAKYVLKIPSLQSAMDPLAAISAADYNIPTPIFDYICGIGPSMTPTGDKVYWNLPDAAIPAKTTNEHNHELRPGSFGPITAANHNVYECYFSPYITSEYIRRTAAHPASSRRYDWNPLPAGWFPQTGIPNENLLGYREIERLHPDAIRKCNECDFDISDTMTGMLCHSAYAMNLTSGVIGTTNNIKVTKADFKPRDNSSAFIYKERDGESDLLAVLWDEPSTLKSPFQFSASASNRANYCAYKRKRTDGIPGTCYTTAGNPPNGWLATINSNFNIAPAFALQRGFRDRESIRANDHEEEEGLGTVTQDIFQWLDTAFIIKRQ